MFRVLCVFLLQQLKASDFPPSSTPSPSPPKKPTQQFCKYGLRQNKRRPSLREVSVCVCECVCEREREREGERERVKERRDCMSV